MKRLNEVLTRLVRILVVIVLFGLVAYQVRQVSETTLQRAFRIRADLFSRGGTAGIRSLLGAASVLFTIIALAASAFAQQRPPAQGEQAEAEPPRAIVRAWWAGMLAAVIVLGGIDFVVDPHGHYAPDIFETTTIPSREFKADLYRNQPEIPDVVIMGSSRAATLSATHMEEQTGLDALNIAVFGGRPDDFLIQMKYMRSVSGTLPEVMMIQLDPALANRPADTATRSPLSLMPYMRPETAALTVWTRIESLLNFETLKDAIYILLYYQQYGPPAPYWTFSKDGQGVRPAPENLVDEINGQIIAEGRLSCEELNPASLRDIEDMVALADRHSSSIVIYTSPVHPAYYSRNLENDPAYLNCEALFNEYAYNLAAQHDNVYYNDYTLLESIGGVQTVEGFWDAFHLAPTNGNLLIDTISPTIEEAYETSLRLRSGDN